jgi:hypothetical protein
MNIIAHLMSLPAVTDEQRIHPVAAAVEAMFEAHPEPDFIEYADPIPTDMEVVAEDFDPCAPGNGCTTCNPEESFDA